MKDRIAKSLGAQFERHRIVVWADPACEMREAYDAIALADVEKLEVANNEFALKHRMLREEPVHKFLVYRPGPKPADVDNWLLDIELAYGLFRADQIAIWRAELGLPDRFDAALALHAEFFRSARRLEKLKGNIRADDTESVVRLRMLAICTGSDGSLDSVMEALLDDLATGEGTGLKLIERVGLDEYLWKQVAATYGYRSTNPSLDDLAITLFKSCYRVALGEDGLLNHDAQVFFNRWKNNRTTTEAFATLSERCAEAIGLEADLHGRGFRTLMDIDFFQSVDRAVIRGLVQGLSDQTVSATEVAGWVRARRRSHWYGEFEDVYEAIGYAAEFHQTLAQTTLGMTSLAEGVTRYTSTWFRLDQHYRKFILHMQRSGQATLMEPLFARLENHYVNTYLLRLNDAWQKLVDDAPTWAADDILPQRRFFKRELAALRDREQRICVVISDALRYEVAEELLTRVREIDRYEATIKPLFGNLPSYTQLGMAALLPNDSLEIADNDTSHVLVDGQNASGLENRKKILAAGAGDARTTALKSEELMLLNKDDARALISNHDVIYIYHNTIDATGDKPATEDRVFEAAETAIDDIVKIAKKLTAANASSVFVTADHGFIYQHRPIEESDFAHAAVAGETILFQNRRFILGRGLKAEHGLRHFTSAEAGLEGSVEMLIPKSINRLRRQGSGSRFVHGGASLQEVVIPVVSITKKRQSDVSVVDVEIIGANRQITSSQFAVVLYQSSPVGPKKRERSLRAGVYGAGVTLISDTHDLVFDQKAEGAREREHPIRFLLTKQADAFNGKDVVLRLEERVGDTSHFRIYREATYLLRRSFTSDFDF